MLKSLPKELLRVGFRLPGALRDKSGRILLKAGTVITDAHITQLRPFLRAGVFDGGDWPDSMGNNDGLPVEPDLEEPEPAVGQAQAETEAKSISVDSLRTGMRLFEDIYDDQGVLLLASGVEITPRFLRALHTRRLRTVTVRIQQDRGPNEGLRSALERGLEEAAHFSSARHDEPGNDDRSASERDWAKDAQRCLRMHADASHAVADVCEALKHDRCVSSATVRNTVSEFIDMLAIDADLLPLIVSLQEPQNEYLFDHCVNVALVSMTMAAHLGMSREQITEVSLGALLADIGMLDVPDKIRLAPRALTSSERLEIERHPMYTQERLARIDGLSTNISLVGYQAHERMNGRGYPRRRSGMFLHQYSKLVAVADVYTAMTRPRPHRPPIIPYKAVRTILYDASCGKLDPACVRAFLDCMSLHPIGSRVELSDGRIVTVVRANAGAHTRPVVLPDGDDAANGGIIDLASRADLDIVRTVSPVESTATPPVSGA